LVNEIDSHQRRGRLVRYAPLLLWTGVILYLSSDDGSMEQTSRFIGPLLHFLFPSAPDELINTYHAYIRKAAHLTEYAILALFAFCAFPGTGTRPRKYLCSILFVLAIAAVDELNQSFSASRTGAGADVLLDLSGGILAMALTWVLYCRKSRSKAT
jgi:VanZ family protein